MVETGGKNPRKPPIQCLGCKGNHMFRDSPHKGEKVRIVHNVQQDEKVKDMGINVPGIYVALDNKKGRYQSHMIEVEGMINNKTITILIDPGSSHSYIDPKMVESFHLLRNKHRKSWLLQMDTISKCYTSKSLNWISVAYCLSLVASVATPLQLVASVASWI
jgi:hypothetical protein